MGDLQEGRGYCKLKEEALDRTMWKTGFGRDYGPVVRKTTGWMNIQYPCLMSDSSISLLCYDTRVIG